MSNINLPAILGGRPIFSKPSHLVRPIMPKLSVIVSGLEDLYESRMFTNQGAFVRSLEKRIEKMLDVKHCALFCNGTVAIMCLARSMELSGNVLVPSFTFAATTQALLWQGIKPRFVDIEKETLTMDPGKIEEQITNETSAIFPVNIFGGACDNDNILRIAKKNDIPLIYDSAQAFGTKYKDSYVGTFGDAEIFSFHATKILHTGEGGAIVTNSKLIYDRVCRIRNFGFEGYLNCTDLGINGKMSEFAALIGLSVMDDLGSHIQKRKWIFQHYRDSLKRIRGIYFPGEKNHVKVNYSSFYVKIDPEEFGLTNIELNYALTADNIITRCYFYPPVHRTRYYRKLFGDKQPELPVTDWAATHVLCLPVYSDMEVIEVAKIVEGIIRCQRRAGEIKKVLKGKIPENWEAIKDMDFTDPHDRFIGGSTNVRDDF